MSEKIENSEQVKPIDNFGGLLNQNSVNYFGGHLGHIHDPYKQLGFVQVGVFADVDELGDKKFPSFTYTIGIEENYNLPELIIVGVSNKTSATIINDIMHWVRTKDFTPEPFKVYNQFTNFKMCLVPVMVPAKETLMTLTNLFYTNKNIAVGIMDNHFNAYQIIWTDTQNHFPWEEEFEEHFMDDALCLFDEETFDKVKDLK